MPDSSALQPGPSSGRYVTPVVLAINTVILLRLFENWRSEWNAFGQARSTSSLLAFLGPADWFFLFVPLLCIALELSRSRWSGLVNVFGHFAVFSWLVLVFILASAQALGFSSPEHVVVVLVSRGLPALGASVLFALLFHRAHRLSPARAGT